MRVLLLFLLAGLGGWFLAGSRDLVQVNSLDLFLEKEGLARYESFRERFDERPTLLGRLRLPTASSENQERLDAGLREVVAIAARHGVELISSLDLPQAPPLPEGGREQEGATEGLLRLKSPRAEAFLAILPPLGSEQGGETEESLREGAVGTALVVDLLALGEKNEFEVDLAGVPYSRVMLDRYSSAIGETLFPLVFFLGFVIVFLLTRDLRSALVVYLPALIGTGIALATIEAMYGSMDMVTSIVPLLVFVLNLGLSLHLRAATLALGSLRLGLAEKARPIGLMVVTTTVGFGALGTSEIESIHRFGVLAAILVVVSALTTILWTIIAAPRTADLEDRTHPAPHLTLGSRLTRFALFRPPPAAVALGLVACATVGVWGISRLPVETDALTYFPASSGIADRVRALQVEVLGTPVYEIVAKPSPTERDSLTAVDRVTQVIEATLGDDVRVLSRSSLLREATRRVGGRAELPPNPMIAAGLWSALPTPLQDAYASGEFERITVFAENRGAEQQREEVERLDQALAVAAPGWSFSYEGMVHELLAAQSALIRLLGKSFALSAGIIAGIFWLACRRLRLVVVFLLTNAIPVLGGLGFVAWLGFSLNVATVMVASVALGMIVDSTLHIVHSLERRSAGGGDPLVDAKYVRSTLEPVLASGAILIPCFLCFASFGFLPIREFGVTLATMIGLALLFDLHAVPTLVDWALRDRTRGAGGSGLVEGFSSSTAEVSAQRSADRPAESATGRAPGSGEDETAPGDEPPGGGTGDRRAEVVIVGAGTAGLTCATRLAERGVSVLVLDAADAPKRHVCGEYLCPSGVTAARAVGGDALLEGFAPIEGMVLVAPDGRVVEGNFPRDAAHGCGLAIDKKVLIERLLERARRAGARVLFDSRVTEIERTAGGWRVELAGGSSIAGEALIGADGRRSWVARALGLTIEDSPARVSVRGFVKARGKRPSRAEMHIGAAGSYLGVNPISADEVNVSVCLDRAEIQRLGGAREALDRAMARSPRFDELYERASLHSVRSAFPITHRVRRPIAANAALVGDAGGFIDPLTGEGITIALATGTALADELAPAFTEAGHRGRAAAIDRALHSFARQKKKQFRAKARLSRILQQVIARPRWCNAIGRALARSPRRMEVFLGVIGNHYSPAGALLRLLHFPVAAGGTTEESRVVLSGGAEGLPALPTRGGTERSR